MKTKLGAILLIAGTCIGSGMIALPMVLAKLGLVLSIVLMLTIWYVMYYTSLINLELNFQAGAPLALGALGKRFSGKTAELLGAVSLKLLSYALLAVFISGGSSILKELINTYTLKEVTFTSIVTFYTLATYLLLLLPIKWIDYINRLLFAGLMAVALTLIIGLSFSVQWSNLPLFSDRDFDLSAWASLIPVVFTSFGFQVIFHTLSKYCNQDAKLLKQAFFWGSLIPAIVYILWTSSVLSVVYHDNPAFFNRMMEGKIEVGELIQQLSHIAKWPSLQLLIWWISSLAIATSVLGVGVGLLDAIKEMLKSPFSNPVARKITACFLTVFPAYLTVICIPNAFIAVLGVAGMILAFIAILLPVYLFFCAGIKKLNYPELNKAWLIYLCVLVGLIVIASELYNLI